MSWIFKSIYSAGLESNVVLGTRKLVPEDEQEEHLHFAVVGQLRNILSITPGQMRPLVVDDQVTLDGVHDKEAIRCLKDLKAVEKRTSHVSLMPLDQLLPRLSLALNEEANRKLAAVISTLSEVSP